MNRISKIALGLVMVIAPMGAVAQVPVANVTTSPLTAGAPVIGLPLLLMLVALLMIGGVVLLRRTSPRMITAVTLIISAAVLGAAGYASVPGSTVTVSLAECTKDTTQPYDPSNAPIILKSECPNPIRVTFLEIDCNNDNNTVTTGPRIPNPKACELGQTLNNGDSCRLPDCDV